MEVDAAVLKAYLEQEIEDAIKDGDTSGETVLKAKLAALDTDIEQLTAAPDPKIPCLTCNGHAPVAGHNVQCAGCGNDLVNAQPRDGVTNYYPENKPYGVAI